MRVQLRDYQVTALHAVRASMAARNRAVLLQAATGAGKTTIFCAVAEGAAKKGKRVLILVHRQELLTQCSASLDKLGVQHGLIAPGYTMTTDHVQVASVQTIVRRLGKIAAPDIIIVDEAHHATAGSWRKVLDKFPKAKVLGVSATPCRLDGQGLGFQAGGIFNDLIICSSYAELEQRGFLVPPRVFAPPSKIDMSAARTVAGEWNRADTEAATDKPTITGDAVAHYSKLCAGAKAVAFCVSLKHAAHVTEAFKSAGYQWAQIDGQLCDTDRKRILSDLARGHLHGISSVDIVSEGFDLPDIEVAIGLRATKSLALMMQQAGRCARPAPGKSHYWLLDHCDNTMRHGMPNEDREWTLDGAVKRKKKKDDAPDIRQCPECFATNTVQACQEHARDKGAPVGTEMCPECDHIFKKASRSGPEHVDGELHEVSADDIAMRRRANKKEEGQARSLEDFQKIAAARGYDPVWARIRWKLRNDRSKSA